MKHEVTITATITKTIVVEDPDSNMSENDIVEEAHSVFTVVSDDEDEKYTQDTISIKKIL